MSGTLRERALRLLARREHTRVELARKLAAYAESVEALDALLDDLLAHQLLSDERYVEMRLRARAARLGDARLTHELRTQGVAAALIDVALADGEDELTRARRVWQRKFGADASDSRARARQIRFMQGRGFSGETIRRLVRGDFEDD
jgi:regulatory protein